MSTTPRTGRSWLGQITILAYPDGPGRTCSPSRLAPRRVRRRFSGGGKSARTRSGALLGSHSKGTQGRRSGSFLLGSQGRERFVAEDVEAGENTNGRDTRGSGRNSNEGNCRCGVPRQVQR